MTVKTQTAIEHAQICTYLGFRICSYLFVDFLLSLHVFF